jgi:hypothetical protein
LSVRGAKVGSPIWIDADLAANPGIVRVLPQPTT